MEIQMIDMDKIYIDTYNPRIDLQPDDKEYRAIENAILEFGMIKPFIVNVNNDLEDFDYTLVSGHQRLKILKSMDHTEIPCVVVELSKDKEKMLNLAMNKITNKFDDNKLGLLLKELENHFDDLTITGLDPREMNVIKEKANVNLNIEDLKKQNDDNNQVQCPRCKAFFER